jgi:hypothetical protein
MPKLFEPVRNPCIGAPRPAVHRRPDSESELKVVGNRLSGAQFIEQRLGVLQIERIEPFHEPAVDRSEKIII